MMNLNRQFGNWAIDALLFVGFVAAMLLDVTGTSAHQWLGIAVPMFAGYHLVRHWAWIKGVTSHLSRTTAVALRFYLVDAALLAGLVSIALSGLAISTWLSLDLASYAAWRTAHVAASVATLALVVAKVGLHWRWIVGTARRALGPAPAALPRNPIPQPARTPVGRRDFIGLMGIVGALALFAGTRALSSEATGTAGKAAAGGVTVDEASESAACVVACGRRCSYPGRCGRYRDTNANGMCDLGECAAS